MKPTKTCKHAPPQQQQTKRVATYLAHEKDIALLIILHGSLATRAKLLKEIAAQLEHAAAAVDQLREELVGRHLS